MDKQHRAANKKGSDMNAKQWRTDPPPKDATVFEALYFLEGTVTCYWKDGYWHVNTTQGTQKTYVPPTLWRPL